MLMHPANRDRTDRLIAAVEARIDDQLGELAKAICEGRSTIPTLLLSKLESILFQLEFDEPTFEQQIHSLEQ
jgi:hypothetical protein